MKYNKKIISQYGDGNIKKRINQAFAYKDTKSITIKDLSHIDELHIGGREATIKLAGLTNSSPGMKVLDSGSGLGGPARILASEFDFIVAGIDLSEEFCNIAAMLTEIVGIDCKKVSFTCCNACNIPFRNENFDIVWSQHSSMNIEDKKKLYSEYKRVLKKGGILVIHDVTSCTNELLHYPVPWANDSSISFLITPNELILILNELGFKKLYISDISEDAIDWYEKTKKTRKKNNIPILGPHLIFGSIISLMASNMKKNLIEKRVKIIETIWCK